MSSVIHEGPEQKLSSEQKISDEELVSLYNRGDASAMDELIRRYKNPLYGFLWRLTRSKSDVEEIFQETWLRVIQKSSSFEQNRFKGWIFKIAYNLVIDWSRIKRGHCSLDQTSEYRDGLQTLGDTLAAPGECPDGNAAQEDLGRAISEAIDTLPEEQKSVFVLRMETNMSFKDIAEIQNISINTALARMQYALTKMRKLLKPLYEDSGRAV